ncbi:hypothetical protein [Yinghuangia seranimata]|uniref:hypothetical protein n=1 Tax=Yinghuangia seranimata TaxID=408067 RepID=UPI00248CB6A1|nr:hypothetical protein [Yinghuangia seranimata]MDI2127590.1 hypothetical protein [Yinghuangia seranimata]
MDGGSVRRRTAAVAAAVVLATALVACSGDGGHTTRGTGPAPGSDWAAGITPEWMSRQMGLPLPGTARSPEAAYESTSRYDTGLLTFTLTRAEADTYLKENPPKGKWLEPTAASGVPPRDFAHFGLPEPETLKDGVRYGYVCPASDTDGPTALPSGVPDTYDTSDERCVLLYAHAYAPDRTRLYLRAHYDPGNGPVRPSP